MLELVCGMSALEGKVELVYDRSAWEVCTVASGSLVD